jgi:SAM-dependent methyltransferase
LKVYLKDRKKLAFFSQKATASFWDQHWQTDELKKIITKKKNDGIFVPSVQRWLPVGSRVLEGGCGQGRLVYMLDINGYVSIGLDYATDTLEKIGKSVSELVLTAGDVRSLPFANGSIDGYVSVGVIEHFWEGYHEIIMEMKRVLRQDGFLFLSFPYLSPLRRWKSALGAYKQCTLSEIDSKDSANFYQFALDMKSVVNDVESYGFLLKDKCGYDGLKGFKDELTWFRPMLQGIYDGKRLYRYRKIIDKLFIPFASHCVMLVFQKVED